MMPRFALILVLAMAVRRMEIGIFICSLGSGSGVQKMNTSTFENQ